MHLTLALLALVAELVFGYPKFLLLRIGHPVMWIGGLIDRLDKKLNRKTRQPRSRRYAGILALLLLLAIALGIGFLLQSVLAGISWGWLLAAMLAGSLIAQQSLASHVGAVTDGFERQGIDAARAAVGQIVGRDTANLDEAGISRAAIESLAENFSDGVVAPVFWLAVAGLPGIIAYKAINTADSMIGHRSEKYREFGWAAARLDDLVNLPASRLTALLVILAASILPEISGQAAAKAAMRDARRHRSPNAGWPEAAFAGALGLALAGPRIYAGKTIDDALMGRSGRREANRSDIRKAIRLFWTADFILIALLALFVLAVHV